MCFLANLNVMVFWHAFQLHCAISPKALNLNMDAKRFYFQFGHFLPRTKQHLVALLNSQKQLSFSL